MQQVVDLQNDEAFTKMGVQLLAISPDPVRSWHKEGDALGITVPMLSDAENGAWMQYGIPAWMMSTNEPGHPWVRISGKASATFERTCRKWMVAPSMVVVNCG